MSGPDHYRRDYLRKAENERPTDVKSRRCLKCQAAFVSTWSGERVCRKCKTQRAWREGIAVNMASWSR